MREDLPRSVLVVRLGAIGDVVNALVFARAYKDVCPEAEIGWVVHPLAEPLVREEPTVDRVHVWDRGVWALGPVVAEVRREGYEAAVDLQRLQKSALVARLSGARRVIGYDAARTKEQSWIWTRERVDAGDPGAHMVVQYREVATWLTGVPATATPRISPSAADAAWAEKTAAPLGAAPLVLNIGASKAANRWPTERWVELARAIRSRWPAPIVVTGGPEDRDGAADLCRALDGGSAVLDLAGGTTLGQLGAFLGRARAVVSGDTGPMHIAAAAGARVVALFGPADPRRTGPFGVDHIVVRANPDGPAPMTDISVAAVMGSLATILAVDARAEGRT